MSSSSPPAKRMIIDCDPGVDDMMALLLATAHRATHPISLVTIVCGNHKDLSILARNAKLALELGGCGSVPVVVGRDTPIAQEFCGESGIEVHGDDGIGFAHGKEAHAAAVAAAEAVARGSGEAPARGSAGVGGGDPAGVFAGKKASEAIAEVCAQHPGEVTVVALGPLCNIAEAVREHDSFRRDVARIVMMGGALAVPGNKTPCAEANVHNDPEAADVVLHSGAEIVMAPLNVTRKVCLETLLRDLAARFDAEGAVLAPFIHAITDHYISKLKSWGQERIPVHDSCAVMAAIKPEVFTEKRHIYVGVELDGKLTRGATVPDYVGHWRKTRPPQVHALLEVDDEAFRSAYVDAIQTLEDQLEQTREE